MRTAICILLNVYWFVLLARILTSWFRPPQSSFVRGLFEIVYDVTEPVLRPVRGILPPVRMGAMGLDLSPVIVFIVLGILQGAICSFGF